MSDLQIQQPGHRPASPSEESPPVTRFDLAHTLGEEPVQQELPLPSKESLEAATGYAGSFAAEQLHIQAGQLAAHLRTRQWELDQRETQLNARQAQLENHCRLWRLWAQQQEQELAERQRQLDRREACLRQTSAG